MGAKNAQMAMRVLRFARKFHREHGRLPDLRECGSHFEWKSPKSGKNYYDYLTDLAILSHTKSKPWGIGPNWANGLIVLRAAIASESEVTS